MYPRTIHLDESAAVEEGVAGGEEAPQTLAFPTKTRAA